ncbi:hypothetical protein N7512_009933 [Penicillium capsulatum]|nr:hypothetical protein N7512_009933 [Penicillium capsulatum]
MPDEQPRRVIIEKSSTVRRRYQRSNKRFQFSAEQLARIERDQERERRAQQLRDKEKKRIANKKKKAEQEALAREERKRTGLPDPHAPKVPSSQPLLSMFLKKPQSAESEIPVELNRESTTAETNGNDNGAETEAESMAGDTEIDSDIYDDLDEEIENEMSALQKSDVQEESIAHDDRMNTSGETLPAAQGDDEFSDCSAFDDEDILREAEAAATVHGTPALDTKNPIASSTLLEPALADCPKSMTAPMTSLGDSFRDETADYLEDVFSRGCGDSFGELIQLDSRAR